jgi:hypothetical protein
MQNGTDSKHKFMIPENVRRVHPWKPQDFAEST